MAAYGACASPRLLGTFSGRLPALVVGDAKRYVVAGLASAGAGAAQAFAAGDAEAFGEFLYDLLRHLDVCGPRPGRGGRGRPDVADVLQRYALEPALGRAPPAALGTLLKTNRPAATGAVKRPRGGDAPAGPEKPIVALALDALRAAEPEPGPDAKKHDRDRLAYPARASKRDPPLEEEARNVSRI